MTKSSNSEESIPDQERRNKNVEQKNDKITDILEI